MTPPFRDFFDEQYTFEFMKWYKLYNVEEVRRAHFERLHRISNCTTGLDQDEVKKCMKWFRKKKI